MDTSASREQLKRKMVIVDYEQYLARARASGDYLWVYDPLLREPVWIELQYMRKYNVGLEKALFTLFFKHYYRRRIK